MVNERHRQMHLVKLDWLIGLGVGMGALVLYLTTMAPGVLEADAGEFQFVPWLPGIAHPTGYPLYVLLGWVWTHLLPLGSVAWRMNLLSVGLAALAVGVTYAVVRKIVSLTLPETPPPAQMISAAVAAATFAVTPTFWSQALIAEVYALHALFVVAILWLALHRRLKLLAFTGGLALTHHVTSVLLFPALGLYWGLTRSTKAISAKLFAICALLFLAPLLLYLYLPLSAPSTPYATLQLSESQTLTLYDNSLSGFLQHVTGTVFTGELQPAAVGAERLRLVGQLLLRQVRWVGVALALIGLVTFWQRRRIDLLLLTGGVFVSFVGFNLIYFIGDVFVLFIPAWLLLCLWLGVGSLSLAHGVARWFVRRKMGVEQEIAFERIRVRLQQRAYQAVVTGLSIFFLALPLALAMMQFTELNQKDNTAATARWQEILAQPIPQSAVLLSNDRNEIMPMWYYQTVEGRRPDLLGLFPLIVPQPEFANVGRVLDQALASGRPIYLIKPMDGLNLKANLTPEGSLVKAEAYQNVAPQTPVKKSLPAITVSSPAGPPVKENISLVGCELSSAAIRPGNQITVTLYWQPGQPLTTNYTSYVHLIAEDGQRVAQSDHQPGGNYYPSSYWRVGEILRDTHTLSISEEALVEEYRLRVGMYYQPQPGVIVGMGDGVEMNRGDCR